MDFINDRSNSQLSVLKSIIPEAAELCKAAGMDDETLESLPPSAFAGIGQFPIHTKAATELSCYYFWLNRPQMPSSTAEFVEGRLKKAATELGIDYAATEEDFKNRSTGPVKWAFSTVLADGEPVKLYPLSGRTSVKQAAEHFYSNRTRYPYSWRIKIAAEILKTAEECGLPSNEISHYDYLLRAANKGISSTKQAAEEVRIRACMVGGEAGQDLLKLAAMILEQPLDYDRHVKYAELLAQTDEAGGLTKFYGTRLNMPEDVLFATHIDLLKQALDSTVELANGRLISAEQLANLPLEKVAEAVGDNLTQALGGPTIGVGLEQLKAALVKLTPQDADTVCLFVPKEASIARSLNLL